jgi:hypothetical protein
MSAKRNCFLPILFFVAIANGFAIIFGPPIIDIAIPPGGEKEVTLTIINESEESARFRLYTTDVAKTRNGEAKFPVAGSTPYSCARNITLTPATVSVGPMERADVKARVSIPFGAEGGRYAMVMCEVVTDQVEDDGIVIAPRWRIGSIIRVTVTGRARREAAVERVVYNPPADGGEGYFTVTVQNRGNIHLTDGQGYLTVITDDRRIASRERLEVKGMIFPGAELDVRVAPSTGLRAGSYEAVASVEYDGRISLPAQIQFEVSGAEDGQPAADLVRLVVEPGEMSFRVPPGGFRTSGLRSRNDEEVPLDVAISLGDIKSTADGRIAEAEVGSTPYSLQDLISVEPDSIVLPGEGGSKTLRLSCATPKNATGGYYGRLRLEATSQAGEFLLSGTVEVDVSIVIPGTEELIGRIMDVGIESVADTILLTIEFSNSGNVLIRPTGEITIENARMERVRSLELPEAAVLPGSTVTLTSRCPNVPEGKYSVTATVDYGVEGQKLYWNEEVDLP